MRKDKREGRFVKKIGDKENEWEEKKMKNYELRKREKKWIEEEVYYEESGERVKGKVEVEKVVMKRVRNKEYKGRICGVVYKKSEWINEWKF